MLDRVEERRGGPRVADIPQPYRPVRPVQQVGVALIRAQGLDEQPPAVRRDRRERPRALASTSAGRTTRRQAGACRSAAAIPAGPIRRSGTPNVTSTAAPTVTPAARARISSVGRTARSAAAGLIGGEPGRSFGTQ